MKTKNVMVTLAGFVCFFIFKGIIFPWDNTNSHPSYNDAIVVLFNSNYEDFFPEEYTINITKDETKYKGMAVTNPGFLHSTYSETEMDYTIFEWIKHGGYSADEPELAASIRHFYDPIGLSNNRKYLTNRGTYWEWVYPNPHIDAIEWAVGDRDGTGNENKWSLKWGKKHLIEALESDDINVKNEKFANAFRCLGEVLHNTADMGCPPHVRNDSHAAPVGWTFGDIFGNPDATEELFSKLYISLYMDNAPDPDLEKDFNSATTIRSIHEKLAQFTNANFFTTQTMNGKGNNNILPINDDGKYPKPLLNELNYNTSEYTFYKDLANGNRIKMAKDYSYFKKKAYPYIDQECVSSQATLLVPNIIWAGLNVVRLFTPNFQVKINSLNEEGEIKGIVSHFPNEEYTSAIKYSGTISIYDSKSLDKLDEINCKSGDFSGTVSNLESDSEIHASLEMAGISIRSKNFKIGDIESSLTGEPCPGIPTVTYGGKIYNTVQIGNQCWLKENLDVGTMLIFDTETSTYEKAKDNNIIEKWCYKNDEINCNKYGGLYEWKEAMQYVETEGAQGICPNGWHIPTEAEYSSLNLIVNSESNPLKAIGEGAGDGAGTNTTGFSALLAGKKDPYNTDDDNSYFLNLNENGYFWTSSNPGGSSKIMKFDDFQNVILFSGGNSTNEGFSIRCILNEGTNKPPLVPSNPIPSNGTTGQSTNVSISWSCSDPDGDPLTYDIYFGKNSNPPLVASNQESIYYNPGTLDESEQYYWKILAKDNNGNESPSAVWSFTTEGSGNVPPTIPSNPNPSNGATEQPTSILLSWSCSDSDGDPLTYNVYFGTSNDPPLVASNQTTNAFNPGSLDNATKYYWKILAKDDNGHEITGPVWIFNTIASNNSGSVCEGTKTVTYQGKTYNTVQIGSQCWFKENLDVGTMIARNGPGDDQTNNSITEKFCYENNAENCDTYGGLYQWDEAMQYENSAGVQGICPEGWHIPTQAEIEILNNAVGGDANALKEIGQGSDPGAGTNTSGFSALLAGYISGSSYYNQGYSIFIWSSTEDDYYYSVQQRMYFNGDDISIQSEDKYTASSIRCLED